MKSEQGDAFSLKNINLAELTRRTGISRAKLRRLKAQDFEFKEHGRKGLKAKKTKLSGYEDTINAFLFNGVSNSNVIFERIKADGYPGGLTILKDYISSHKNLMPAKRQIVCSQGNRGRRYQTTPGEASQLDWGFVHVENGSGGEYRAACFAMVCHHCGKRYIEFFPNAKQENLFIGMLHCFEYMGVPNYVQFGPIRVLRQNTFLCSQSIDSAAFLISLFFVFSSIAVYLQINKLKSKLTNSLSSTFCLFRKFQFSLLLRIRKPSGYINDPYPFILTFIMFCPGYQQLRICIFNA